MNVLRALPIPVLLISAGPATADPKAVPAAPAPAAAQETASVLQVLRADIRARPSRVLIAVEDALVMNELAACEIVREAMILTKADAKLTGDIVFTALKSAPAMTAVIVECAVRQQPEAVDHIRAAVKRALGKDAATALAATGSEPAAAPETAAAAPEPAAEPAPEAPSGKGVASTGKGSGSIAPPMALPEEEDWIDYNWVGVGGIYLQMPSGTGSSICYPNDPCCSTGLSPSCLKR